ncbi:hypothetical protein OIU74_006845 [Salix koriyanagi]|uniref:Uncharacterized protein n=1 Tax=Salix koriyanagi TaxID=2511006 RepID=A0A9Q0UFH8_9ROSI|nr:hypothetical protein OIU74_006845 [Salix koriyanagi]
MTTRRPRRQPDHHIESYPYPAAIFDEASYPITNDIYPIMDESFVGVSSSLDIESAYQSLFDHDAHIGFHYEDPSAVASSSSGPSLRSKSHGTEHTNVITPLSSDNLSSLVSNCQAEDQPINDPSMTPDQYNIIGQSSYQKKRKRELFQHS